eukprot:scaffold2995_cov135-Skeletonema_menzelii.AAC.6
MESEIKGVSSPRKRNDGWELGGAATSLNLLSTFRLFLQSEQARRRSLCSPSNSNTSNQLS